MKLVNSEQNLCKRLIVLAVNVLYILQAANLVVGLQVVVYDCDTNGEVSSVVGVGPVPALRPKLPPLHHNGMEIDEGEQDALELILL